jgi:hypothetical protein
MTTQSPLHLAAAQGRRDICLRLLKAGAKVDALDGYGCTPLSAVMLTYSLIQRGGVAFRTPGIRAKIEQRLAKTLCVLRDHGADFALVQHSIHGPFDAATEAWAHDVDMHRVSAHQQRELELHTSPATGNQRTKRL